MLLDAHDRTLGSLRVSPPPPQRAIQARFSVREREGDIGSVRAMSSEGVTVTGAEEPARERVLGSIQIPSPAGFPTAL